MSSGFLCALILNSIFAAPGDYAWPLGREAAVSGAFGEYRDGHFHTGADFSTGGTAGKPVHAVADGEVVRLVDSLTGFGKAVYVRHPDGNLSVYAHLESFAGAIGDVVRNGRRRLAFRDRLDTAISAGQLPVRRGEILGRSGESGAGLPHLHFELRRADEFPIHPFKFLPRPSDRLPPQFVSIAFLPASDLSSVNGARRATIIPLDASGGTRNSDPPSLEGVFEVYVTARDLADLDTSYRLSPAEIEFSVDGRDTQTIRFDELSYRQNENKKVGLLYDLSASSAPLGLYTIRLWTDMPRPVAPSADYSPELLNAGRLDPGLHRLVIVLRDTGGNEAKAEFPVRTFKTRGGAVQSRVGVMPKRSDTTMIIFPGGEVVCEIPPGACYRFRPEFYIEPFNDTLLPEESTRRGVGAAFFPAGEVFSLPVRLSMAMPSVSSDTSRWGVFRFDALRRRWAFVGGGDTPMPDRRINVAIDRFAAYGVFDDAVPPRINAPARKLMRKGEELRWPVSDRGSGISEEKSELLIDGKQTLDWYYDADRSWVRVSLSRVVAGKRRFELILRDKLGNKSRRRVVVHVR